MIVIRDPTLPTRAFTARSLHPIHPRANHQPPTTAVPLPARYQNIKSSFRRRRTYDSACLTPRDGCRVEGIGAIDDSRLSAELLPVCRTNDLSTALAGLLYGVALANGCGMEHSTAVQPSSVRTELWRLQRIISLHGTEVPASEPCSQPIQVPTRRRTMATKTRGPYTTGLLEGRWDGADHGASRRAGRSRDELISCLACPEVARPRFHTTSAPPVVIDRPSTGRPKRLKQQPRGRGWPT